MIVSNEINKKLSDNADSLIPKWYPDAKKTGNSWKLAGINGGHGNSASIYRGKGGEYWFHDFNGGDNISMIGMLAAHLGVSRREAIVEAMKMLGMTNVKSAHPVKAPKKWSVNGKHFGKANECEEVIKYLTETRKISTNAISKYNVSGQKRIGKYGENHYVFGYRTPDNILTHAKSIGVERGSDDEKDVLIQGEYYSTLWGWWNVTENDSAIVITEGEIDALSAYDLWKGCPVLSLPMGASDMNWIDHDWAKLCQFEIIYLMTDHDDPGESSSVKIAERLGRERCFRVKIPDGYKDANKYLCDGDGDKVKAIRDAFAAAETYKPDTIQAVHSLNNKMHNLKHLWMTEAGQPSNFVIDVPFRYRNGECTAITGYPGHGKSQFAYQSFLHEIINNDRRALMVSLEIPPENMLLNMAWMHFGGPPPDSFDNEIFKEKLFFCGEASNGWEGLMHDILYGRRRNGCDLIMIDSLMYVVAKDDWKGQDKVLKDISRFCIDENSSIVLIAHSDAKKGGGDRVPEQEDILGSQGIGAILHNGISIWRNKEKEKLVDQGQFVEESLAHDAIFYVWKQRNTGRTVYRKLKYEQAYKTFSEY